MNNFKLYANCIPVKGANRSVICDLQKKDIYFIPNDLYDVLMLKNKSLDEIKLVFENKYNEVIDEYFDFLVKNDLGFFTNTPEMFPDLKMDWYYPFEISNAIIDFDENSNYNINSVLDQLDELNCKHIQIRFYKIISKQFIENLVCFLDAKKSIIISIDFVILSNNQLNEKELNNLLINYPRINSFSIHGSNLNKVVPPIRDGSGYIIFSKEKINKLSCGIISSEYFIVNMKSFVESKKQNSCLNGKISIDVNGDIKNCPSMNYSFGNIKNISLKKVLEFDDFKKNWAITKDNIITYKDCEFRYVCTDCRAYLEEPNNIYSKPLKCGYNPYTNEWQEWSTNPLKQKAKEHYGF